MAAETLTGRRALTAFSPEGHGYGAALYACWGSYAIAANVEDGDIFEMCKTPTGGGGFLALGGWLSGADIDTGTEAMDIDLGWAANGSASQATMVSPWGTSYSDSGYTASATGLGNFGVWSGDGITDLFAAGQNYRPIVLTTPLWFAKPTTIQLEANVAANAFTAGTVTVCLTGLIL